MYNLNFKEGNYPIIIKPNLGQPLFVNLKDFKGMEGELYKKINRSARRDGGDNRR